MDKTPLHLINNVIYQFHSRWTLLGLRLTNVSMHHTQWADEDQIIPPAIRDEWAEAPEVGGRGLLHIGEMASGDLPIAYLTMMAPKRLRDYRLTELIEHALHYAQEVVGAHVSNSHPDHLRHFNIDVARSRKVITMIVAANDSDTQIDLLINTKIILGAWQDILNASYHAQISGVHSVFHSAHLLTAVDIGTTVENFNFVNPVQERLLARSYFDSVASRRLITSITSFHQRMWDRTNDAYQLVEGLALSQGAKYVINTYFKQLLPQDTPIVTPIAFAASASFGATELDLNLKQDISVMVAFRRTNQKAAQQGLDAILQTTPGRHRIQQCPESTVRVLAGFCHYVLTIARAAYTADGSVDDDSLTLATWLLGRLLAKESNGAYFAILNTDFYGVALHVVNTLFDADLKMDPQLAMHLTSHSPCYPVGYQTLRVSIREGIRHAVVPTRKLEAICKKLNLRSKKERVGANGGATRVMALYPVNNRVMWLESRPRSRQWPQGSDGGVTSAVDLSLPMAVVNGLHHSLGADNVRRVLCALLVPTDIHKTARWCTLPGQQMGVALTFNRTTDRNSFLCRLPVPMTHIGVAAPWPADPSSWILRQQVFGDASTRHTAAQVIAAAGPKTAINRSISYIPLHPQAASPDQASRPRRQGRRHFGGRRGGQRDTTDYGSGRLAPSTRPEEA